MFFLFDLSYQMLLILNECFVLSLKINTHTHTLFNLPGAVMTELQHIIYKTEVSV